MTNAASRQKRIAEAKSELVNHEFQNYVQSVAFSITLSKGMIATLGLVRDYGWPAHSDMSQDRAARNVISLSSGGADCFIPHFRSLKHRGLVSHHPSPGHLELMKMSDRERAKWRNHRHYQLTKAGKIVCDLLVEAGLLPEP